MLRRLTSENKIIISILDSLFVTLDRLFVTLYSNSVILFHQMWVIIDVRESL